MQFVEIRASNSAIVLSVPIAANISAVVTALDAPFASAITVDSVSTEYCKKRKAFQLSVGKCP